MTEELPKLTGKMKKWADAYLVTLNKTEAARRAGYGGSDADLANIGYQNYRKLEIQAYIKAKLDEMAMPAEEVLARLADQASADMSEFVKFEDGIKLPFLDLKGANEKGLLRLVKKFKYNSDGKPEIELYDAQAALVHIGKQHGLFADHHIVDVRLEKEVDTLLDILEQELSSDDYQRILARLGGSTESQGETGSETE